MRKVPAGIPTIVLTLLALILCLNYLLITNCYGVPRTHADYDAPFQMQPATQIIQYEFLNEVPQGQNQRCKLVWKIWIVVTVLVVQIRIAIQNLRHIHDVESIPTSREFLLLCMHDIDGKKRCSF
ncbi:MAG TPA: hypothetical protein VJ869_04400 [Sphaerochaeta sp.]|nr:hypothetical protein [Sphaerochaeta sp.]